MTDGDTEEGGHVASLFRAGCHAMWPLSISLVRTASSGLHAFWVLQLHTSLILHLGWIEAYLALTDSHHHHHRKRTSRAGSFWAKSSALTSRRGQRITVPALDPE